MPLATDREIALAVEILRRGGLVGLPTETVYGLGADAESAVAVRRIFMAKGRPADHPLIVHLPDNAELDGWTSNLSPAARRLAAAFWPGPLTLVLHRGPRASDVVTGGHPTVGIRVPRHPIAQKLLRRFGGGIAAPSANRFGRVSPTCAAHVADELGERLDLLLDGGPCEVGLESTIVDLSGPRPSILRPGGVTREQLSDCLGTPIDDAPIGGPAAPGRLASHYAPEARVEIVSDSRLAERAAELSAQGLRVAVLASDTADLTVQARSLYAAFRDADAQGCDVILVTQPHGGGLAPAIADRLRKAAGLGFSDSPCDQP